VFDQFAALAADLAAGGGLPAYAEAEDLWQDLWHAEVHHSTAVEGNTLTPREVEALLQAGRAEGAKALADYLEVAGYAEASRWVFDQAGPGRAWPHDGLIVLAELRELHWMALRQVWEAAPHPAAQAQEGPGSFRLHEIATFPGGMKPPTFPLVPAMLEQWIRDVNGLGAAVKAGQAAMADVPTGLARLHAAFERIHPFLDGNGRAGRLALNLVLVRLGLAPVVILKSQRRRYLGALAKADADEPGPLAAMLAQAEIASLHRLLPRLTPVDGLLPLAALADERLSPAALRQAVARGRLDATLGAAGAWRTSRAAVDAYLASRQRRPRASAALCPVESGDEIS
jgi:fido (protein-threonine AMPylation protein)